MPEENDINNTILDDEAFPIEEDALAFENDKGDLGAESENLIRDEDNDDFPDEDDEDKEEDPLYDSDKEWDML